MLFWVRLSLALAALFFLPQVRESFESPKAAALRVCGFAALGMALASWRSLKRVTWTPLDLAILAWLAVEALATAFSAAPLLSLVGEPVQREGLITSAALAALYLAARAATPDRAAAERTLDVALLALAGAASFSLAQAARLDPLHWVPPSPYDPIGAGDRPFGTLGHPNLLGLASAAAAAGCVARAWAGRARALHVAGAALFLAATLLTLSRAAWLGLAAGVGLVAILMFRAGRARLSWRAFALAALVLAVALVPIALSPWGAQVAARVRALVESPLAGSGAARIEIWRAAIAAWHARPWLGYGPDTFALVFPRHQTPAYWRFEWGGLAFHAHSIYLHALATRGIVGLAAGVAWGLAALAAARRAWHAGPDARPLVAACCGMLATLLVAGGFGSLGVTGHLLVVICSATLATLVAPTATALAGPAWRAFVGVGLATLAGLGGARELAASRAWDQADESLARARATAGAESEAARIEALDRARRAVSLDLHDDAVPRLLSEASLAAAAVSREGPAPLLAQATGAARRALALVRDRVENSEQLARVLAARVATGDSSVRAEAQAELDRMVSLAPVNARILGSASRLELLLGDSRRALALARRTTALYPMDAHAHAAAAAVLLATGDRASAAAELERALAGEWHGDSAAKRATEAALSSLR